jgi:hypothetical protein
MEWTGCFPRGSPWQRLLRSVDLQRRGMTFGLFPPLTFETDVNGVPSEHQVVMADWISREHCFSGSERVLAYLRVICCTGKNPRKVLHERGPKP